VNLIAKYRKRKPGPKEAQAFGINEHLFQLSLVDIDFGKYERYEHMDIIRFIIRLTATFTRSTFREVWSHGQTDVVMMDGGLNTKSHCVAFLIFPSLY